MIKRDVEVHTRATDGGAGTTGKLGWSKGCTYNVVRKSTGQLNSGIKYPAAGGGLIWGRHNGTERLEEATANRKPETALIGEPEMDFWSELISKSNYGPRGVRFATFSKKVRFSSCWDHNCFQPLAEVWPKELLSCSGGFTSNSRLRVVAISQRTIMTFLR